MIWENQKVYNEKRFNKKVKIGDIIFYKPENKSGEAIKILPFNEEIIIKGIRKKRNFELPVKLSDCLIVCSNCKSNVEIIFEKENYIKDNGKNAERLVRVCSNCNERIR
jgi:hypothetical protein